MHYRGPGFLTVVIFGSLPPLPLPSASFLSFSVFLWSAVELTDDRGGGRNIRRRESLVLYNTFNTLWRREAAAAFPRGIAKTTGRHYSLCRGRKRDDEQMTRISPPVSKTRVQPWSLRPVNLGENTVAFLAFFTHRREKRYRGHSRVQTDCQMNLEAYSTFSLQTRCLVMLEDNLLGSVFCPVIVCVSDPQDP